MYSEKHVQGEQQVLILLKNNIAISEYNHFVTLSRFHWLDEASRVTLHQEEKYFSSSQQSKFMHTNETKDALILRHLKGV